MSATLSKLRISWVGKALLAYAVSALARWWCWALPPPAVPYFSRW